MKRHLLVLWGAVLHTYHSTWQEIYEDHSEHLVNLSSVRMMRAAKAYLRRQRRINSARSYLTNQAYMALAKARKHAKKAEAAQHILDLYK
jgi:hypothetical protein